ncbi:MAG: hypothetical protein DMF84_01750 [Acidobacteria bacterium]|nr:MAG: hypothetical protein DMF84_01750 [Acidobacteriota bacterium]
MMASTSLGVGVLSKMTVPRSRTDTMDEDSRGLRWVVHHHAPNADPTTPAIIPRVRLVKSASAIDVEQLWYQLRSVRR